MCCANIRRIQFWQEVIHMSRSDRDAANQGENSASSLNSSTLSSLSFDYDHSLYIAPTVC